jgi:hypothetical protein
VGVWITMGVLWKGSTWLSDVLAFRLLSYLVAYFVSRRGRDESGVLV